MPFGFLINSHEILVLESPRNGFSNVEKMILVAKIQNLIFLY